MPVLKYFKTTPGRPPIGRQALIVIFFFKFATRSLAKKNAKGPVAPPPSGDHWAPPTGAAGGPVDPLGRPGYPPLYKHPTPHSLLI